MTVASALLSFARVRVAAATLAIDTAGIERAIPVPPGGLGRVPRRSGALAGVIAVDGVVIPVVALGEWVELGPSAGATLQAARILILRGAQGRFGVLVDELLGVDSVPRLHVQRIHGEDDPQELFDCALPSREAGAPPLPLLEVGRLMRLAKLWCEQDGLPQEAGLPAVSSRRAGLARYAVFAVGSPDQETLFAFPVATVTQVVAAPVPESVLKMGARHCGITNYRGRKIAMVDMSAVLGLGANLGTGWMAVLAHDEQMLGVCVGAAKRLVDLSTADIKPAPEQALLQGLAHVEDLGDVRVLDMDRLFAAAPESAIGGRVSRTDAAPHPAPDGAVGVAHIVYETDRRYASPVTGIVGIVPLDRSAAEALGSGSSAMIRWRDRAVRVSTMPSLDSQARVESKLAVIVQTGDEFTGIAIHRLEAWLPPRSVQPDNVRMGSAGEISMITLPSQAEHASLMVIDLQDMGHLLS